MAAGGLLMLILLCAVMGIASFLAGILPLLFSLSERQLRLITALGTGVLVGTSLIVIIPEGVETLYSAGKEGGHGHGHERRAAVLQGRRHVGLSKPAAVSWSNHERRDDVLDSLGVDGNIAVWETTEQSAAQDITIPSTSAGETGHDEDEEDDHDHTGPEPHAWVGLSLVSGFVLMYLIDTLPRALASSQTKPRRFSISLISLSFNHSADNTAEAETPTQESSSGPMSTANLPKPNSTTLGLLIHATADGIALGASSASNTNTGNRLTLVIFLALMLHKAPAAFGLTAVLLKQGLSKRMARAHLIVFSLAAPVGAIGTWIVAKMFAGGSSAMSGREPASTQFATGVLLLFSGGTFLYVAVHTMLESSSGGHEHDGNGQVGGNGYLGLGNLDVEEGDGYGMGNDSASKHRVSEGGGVVDVLVTVAGMLLPLLTGLGGHGH
ncbi:hypothetical protein LTR78_008130 [Recurvomyces mirabilis]|uniref:Uncharacterized protein n=1 Tax=Recurvomyces mirabilis TaxID=574656 RepID=A0AAE0WJ25_9PEZI|nr:hypothetical protein LTR78_008130 [Recurvomyces mirabilis]KAK5150669.1 hypothetical protein LTS14_009952 [Recurvomyces mirabilis]